MHARAQASNRLARANRASHGPRVRAKARVKKTIGNPKESPKEPKVRSKVPKAHTRGKTSKTGLSGLENSKSERSSDTQESAQTCPPDNPWIHDGWSPDEWNDGVLMNRMMTGVRLDGTKVGKRTTILKAPFHLEVWILVPRVVRNGLNGRR